MFKNFFKKEKKESSNGKNILIIALLIHAAKIDENYTENEKKIIKQAIIHLNQKNPDTGQRRTLGRVIICSVKSTTPCKGSNCSNRCNDSNKNDYRYMVTWDVFTNLKVYKFNMKKNQWCSGKICRSMNEFN